MGVATTAAAQRRGLSVLVVAVCVTAAVTVSAAAMAIAHVVPPPGTPDLSQSVLQPSDFTHGGSIQQEGYSKPSSIAVVASYSRVFGASTVGRANLLTVVSEANLITDAGTANAILNALNHLARTPRGQRVFLQPFIHGVNQAAHKRLLTVRDFRVLRVHRLRAGDGSFILPTALSANGLRFSLDYVVVRGNRALGTVLMFGRDKIPASDALTLARAMARHMRSVLSAPATS